MCGRYTQSRKPGELQQLFGFARADDGLAPSWNIAPTQTAGVVVHDGGTRRLAAMRWGFGDRAVINARAETVHEKPMFRGPYSTQRCLVPADGFYEWKKIPRQRLKQPVFFRLESGAPFAFAGLWDRWAGKEAFTILTTAPNAVVEPVHDRMPVMLKAEDFELWLDPAHSPASVRGLLRAYPAVEMECWDVSTKLNQAGVDGPGLVEPETFL